MKKQLLQILLMSCVGLFGFQQGFGQTLSTGDLAIIGLSVDDEKVLIVALEDIPSGEFVFFTDEEWGGSSFNSGEGFYEWITPSISAGTVFEIETSGTTVGGAVSQKAGSLQLSNSGDGFYLYQTSTNVYNTGSYNIIGFAGEDSGDAGTLTGTGLDLGSSAIYFGGDNGIYVGTRIEQDKAAYLSLIYGSIWTTSGSSQTFDSTNFSFASSGPTITADPNPVTGLGYVFNSQTSSIETFTIGGANLDNTDVTLTLPSDSDFEIAETSGGTYFNTIILTTYDGSDTDIFIRLISGLPETTYTENINITGGGLTDPVVLAVSGEVTPPPPPTIILSETTLTELDYIFNNGPSDAQSFDVSGTNLDATDVIISAPTNFEISTTEAGTYASSQTLTAFDGTLTTIWVRLPAGLSNDSYSGDITVSGGGDTTDAIILISGDVTAPSYCSSSFNSDDNDAITNVLINTLNNTSGDAHDSNSIGYQDFTALLPTNLEQGETYNLSVNIDPNGAFTYDVWAFFDWDGDFDFDSGIDESYDLGDRNSIGVLNANIIVPVGASLGTTRMRIVMINSDTPDACDPHPSTFGETEDYTIEVIATNTNDTNTIVSAASTQVPASTQVAADVTTSVDSFAVLGFVIEDQGTTDGLATQVTSMRLVPGANNTADWTDHIQGISLVDIATNYSPTVSISNTEITLDFSPAISIDDTNSIEFELGVYLKTTSIVDASVIQFQIDAASSGFTAENTGSGFADLFTADVVGNDHTIDVEVTEIVYTQQPPSLIEVNQAMPDVIVQAQDINGNVDIDYNLVVELTSTGTLDTSPISATAVLGVATFSNITHTVVGSGLFLIANDGLYPTVNSSLFNVFNPPIIIALEDFDGSNPSWPNNISDLTFQDPSSTSEGLFIKASTFIGDGNTAFGRDTQGEGSEPSLGSTYTFNFDEVNVSNFSNITLSFDYYVFANADAGSYQILIDGIPQTAVEFYNDPDTNPVQGTIIETIGTATGIELIISGSLNGGSDVMEFDNFKLEGNYDGDLIYAVGAWLPNAPSSSTGADDALVQDGTYITPGDISLNSISVLGGANFEVRPNDVLTIDSSINNNGTFTFKSDATGSAQLADATGAISIDEVTVERYISNKRAYRFLSSSVTSTSSIRANWQEGASAWNNNPNPGFGTHITGLAPSSEVNADIANDGNNGFDWSPSGDASLYISLGINWQAIDNTDVNSLTAGTAYRLFVRGDRDIDLADNAATPSATTIRSTGEMLIGPHLPTLNSGANEFSFVGNPYQAVVDFNAVNRSSLTDFIYVWDATIAGVNGRGGYVTVEVSAANTAPSPSSSDASDFIAPGQAFLVHNTALGNSSITFNQAHKETSADQVTVFSTYTNFYINSRLYKTVDLQNGAMESDAIGLRFNENFTTLGSEEDAIKFANPGENYAIDNNGLRSIDKQGLPADAHEIDLVLLNYDENNYSLTFDLENTPENTKVYLSDAYLSTQTELEANATYDFTVDAAIPASIAFNRFKLVFENVSLSQTEFAANNFTIYPNPVQDELNISISAELLNEPVQIEVFDMLGRRMMQQEVIFSDNETQQIDATNLNTGVYLVHMTFNNKTYTHRIIKM